MSNSLVMLLLLLLSLLLLMLYSRLLHLGRFFSFLILHSVGRTPCSEDQPVARPQPTHRTTETQNRHIQTSMSRVEFEPKTPLFNREKTVYFLDRVATVIGSALLIEPGNYYNRTPNFIFHILAR
jgi:hypothetical protein